MRVASNLKSRLSRLREMKAGAEDHPFKTRPSAGGPRLPTCLASWERLDDFVYTRRLVFPCAFPALVDPRPFAPRGMEDHEAYAGPLEKGKLLFFDLETTGLSGGSGTVAFLAALGRIEGEILALEQVFLSDYPGEGMFLETVLRRFLPGLVLVSYNGRAFDMPLLRTRCVMNRMASPALPHLDLLHCARRLWRRNSGGASLGLLEATVLGKERGEDVPGARIPAIWFDFLRTGGTGELGAVLSHNAEDVASLAALFALAQRIFDQPLHRPGGSGIDLLSLGRSLIAAGRAGEGEAVLEEAALGGDDGAAIRLSRRYAKAGRLADRKRMMGILGDGLASEIEKAKYCEHQLRDYAQALLCVERAMVVLGREGPLHLWRKRKPSDIAAELEHRALRLRRKMASGT